MCTTNSHVQHVYETHPRTRPKLGARCNVGVHPRRTVRLAHVASGFIPDVFAASKERPSPMKGDATPSGARCNLALAPRGMAPAANTPAAHEGRRHSDITNMAKSLTDSVKSARISGKGLSRKVAIGAIGLASYLASPQGVYADKFVNNTMNYTTINSVIASAASGEDVHFATGVYQLPMIQGAHYDLVNPGVDIVADGAVTLRGATPTSGRVVRVNSVNSRVVGFVIEGALLGIQSSADFDPAAPIYIQNNVIQNVEKGIEWDNKSVSGSNLLPSIIVDGNYLKSVSRGNIFNEQGIAANSQTSWAQISNCTFEEITVIGSELPSYPLGNTATPTRVVAGLGALDKNLYINCDGVPLSPSQVTGLPGPIASSTTASATSPDLPDKNGEFQDGLNPAPGYEWVDYIKNTHGGRIL